MAAPAARTQPMAARFASRADRLSPYTPSEASEKTPIAARCTTSRTHRTGSGATAADRDLSSGLLRRKAKVVNSAEKAIANLAIDDPQEWTNAAIRDALVTGAAPSRRRVAKNVSPPNS